MSQFVISRKNCGRCGQVKSLNTMNYTRPFQYQHNYYYKPHSVIGQVGSSSRANIWRKIYTKC